MKKRSLRELVSLRAARMRKATEKHTLLRSLGGRGAITLGLGAALSLGGISQAYQGVHFTVQKDLDAVRVVKQQGSQREILATVTDGFAATSVYKLSELLPQSVVTRRLTLFNPAWMPDDPANRLSPFEQKMSRINNAIRRQFFANAIPFGDLIHEKARKYNVDPALVAAVVETESRFRTHARSHVGAQGLMQLMPRTGRWMGARNLYDPAENVDAGAKYLKYLQARFDGNLNKTIAAYNAGEGNVKRYNGVPPFRETQGYVKKVLTSLQKRNEQLKAYGAQPDPPMMQAAK